MGAQDFFAEMQTEFLTEALGMMEKIEFALLNLKDQSHAQESVVEIFRIAHSLKGGGAAVGFKVLADFAHKVEDLLAQLRGDVDQISPEIVSLLLKCSDAFKLHLQSLSLDPTSTQDFSELIFELVSVTTEIQQKANDAVNQKAKDFDSAADKKPSKNASISFIKVDDRKVESLMDSVGEVVVLKNQILYDTNLQGALDPHLSAVIQQMDRLVRDLYDKALSLRLAPLDGLFLKIQRIVRDVSLQVGKNVELVLTGQNTEIERTVADILVDPIVHMVRNALDHGIETPAERKEKGKPEVATICVSAEQIGGSFHISIKDDGHGINIEKVKAKAVSTGLIDAQKANQLASSEVYKLMFEPGFSTAEVITDLSGRGVGLDVVKANVEKIGGKIHIQSEPNKGSTFTLSIPLSTAIIEGMIFRAKGENFIIPVQSIKEILQIENEKSIQVLNQGKVAQIRDSIYSVFHWMDCQGKIGFVLETAKGKILLLADEVLGQTQAVVKPLSVLTQKKYFSGAAVMGDGSTVLILNVHDIAEEMKLVS